MTGHNSPAIRVLHLASGDLWAGAENMIYQLVREQSKTPSIFVSVLLLNDGLLAKSIRILGVPVKVADEQSLSFAKIVGEVLKTTKNHEINVIHSHRRKENIIASFCTLYCRRMVSIRTTHGSSEHDERRSMLGKVVDYIDLICAKYIQSMNVFVSKDLATRELERYGARKSREIENGIDPDALPLRRNRQLDRSDKRWVGPLSLIFVGRLVRVKRLDILLSAAEDLARLDAPVSIQIVGDGPLFRKVQSDISAKSLGNVELMGFRDDAHRLISDADVMVITSDHEGLPMCALEAMYIGTLVLYRSIPDLESLFEFGKYGIPWNPEAESLGNAILQLVGEFESMGHRVSAARQIATTKYSIKNTAQKYESLYRQVIGNS